MPILRTLLAIAAAVASPASAYLVRIVGDLEPDPDRVPYLAHYGRCGGILIAPGRVLTAVQCIDAMNSADSFCDADDSSNNPTEIHYGGCGGALVDPDMVLTAAQCIRTLNTVASFCNPESNPPQTIEAHRGRCGGAELIAPDTVLTGARCVRTLDTIDSLCDADGRKRAEAPMRIAPDAVLTAAQCLRIRNGAVSPDDANRPRAPATAARMPTPARATRGFASAKIPPVPTPR